MPSRFIFIKLLTLLFYLMVKAHSMTTIKLSSQLSSTATANAMSDNRCNIINIRPFDLSLDMEELERICGKGDYLLGIADKLVQKNSESVSTFSVVLDPANDDDDDNHNKIVAVANYRRIGPSSAWLECVRTCPDQRGKGYATKLIQHFLQLAESEERVLLSCTEDNNISMQRVFTKCNIHTINQIQLLDFLTARKLKGWRRRKNDGDDNNNTDDDNQQSPPQPLLQALKVEHLISQNTKYSAENEWSIHTNRRDIENILKRIEKDGGCGHVPSIYNIISHQELTEAAKNHRVFAFDEEGKPPALMVFIRDERISSMQSPWVCCIAGTTVHALESALWLACTNESVFSKLDGHKTFMLAFDNAIPVNIDQTVPAALPLTTNSCLLFSSRQMKGKKESMKLSEK